MNKEITSLILKAYNIYKKECLQKEFLYIFKNKNKIEGISIEFSMNNFIHLTGIKNYNKKNMLYKLKNNEISSEKIFVDKFTNFTYINNNMLKTLINNEDFKEVVDEKLYKKLVIKIEKITTEKSKEIDDDFER